jgi:hypothetical protein
VLVCACVVELLGSTGRGWVRCWDFRAWRMCLFCRCRSFVAARVPSPVKRSAGDGPRSPPKLVRRATGLSRDEAYTSGRSSVLTKCLVRLVLGYYRQDIVEVGGGCCLRCGWMLWVCATPSQEFVSVSSARTVFYGSGHPPTPPCSCCSASNASLTSRCGLMSWKRYCVSHGHHRPCDQLSGSDAKL